jgi:WD40 repeat protein
MTDPCATSLEDEAVAMASEEDVFSHSQPTSSSPSMASPAKKRRFKAGAEVDGWQVQRKDGHVLQLRLAKNRFLQLAANGNHNALSPITLDSGLQSPRKKRTFNPLVSPGMMLQEEWNSDFESNVLSGMVWVEVARTIQVTAVAMSRNGSSEEATCPLLMAVGGEDGVVTVTELLDEHQHSIQDSLMRKFGETLELPLEGRIRSLDFSPNGEYLVIGGDGCTAVLLRVIRNPHTGVLQDLEILQQVERVDRVYGVQFSPDSSTLAIGGFDGKVAFGSVDALLTEEAPSLIEVSRPGLIYCLDWSPDGSYVAVGGSDKCCAILDSEYNLVHETLRSTAVQTMKWNNDGTYLAIGDREVAILECGTFAIKCEISNTPTSSNASSASSSRYRITSLCWSPDGTFLAVGGSDGICLVVETKGYALVHEVHRSESISCLAWGQQRITNGVYRRYLAISDESCKLAILKAGAEIEGSISESDDVSSAASSSYLSNGSDWVLREDCFRDIDDSPLELPSGVKPQGNITSVAFSRSAKSKASSYLAYAADDCSLTIMTTRDWKAVFVSNHRATVQPDSKIFLTILPSCHVSKWNSRNLSVHLSFHTRITILRSGATKECSMFCRSPAGRLFSTQSSARQSNPLRSVNATSDWQSARMMEF